MSCVKFKGSKIRYITNKESLLSAIYKNEEIKIVIDETKAFNRKNEIWFKYENFAIFFYESLFFLDDLINDHLVIYTSNKKAIKEMLKYIKYNFELNKSEYLELKKIL